MVLDRTVQINEDRSPQPRRISLSRQRPGDVRNSRRVMLAQALPELFERSTVILRRLAGNGRSERIDLERPDVSPPPFLVACAGPGKRLKPRERLAPPLDQPRRLVSIAQKCLESLFGEAHFRVR